MKTLLLKPAHTSVVLIVGLAALATLCASVALAFSTPQAVAGVPHIRLPLTVLVVVLAAICAGCLGLAAAGRSIGWTVAPNSALLHPHITLAALIAGLASIGGLCTSIAIALSPLETVAGLETLRPHVTQMVVWLGAASAVCLALAAVGRSVSQFIDNNGQPAAPDAK